MTVEQQTLPRHNKERIDFAKIEEVTGIYDHSRIAAAIGRCRNEKGSYELEDVINVLLAEAPSVRVPPARPHSAPGMQPAPAPRTSTQPVKGVVPVTVSQATETERETFVGPRNKPPDKQGVIDLTNDPGDGDDLQKAIAASLQDTPGILGGQISREDQEISRALEANLAENKYGTKRKRGELWFVDPLNPHERKRKEGWPVGMKNVGNTCWFSAVIQENRNLRFMMELRRLFGLAVGSKRKYLDPSKAVDILKEAFAPTATSGSVDSQQDVSEFQHKLLEWLEDAFRSDQSRPSSPAHGASSAAGGATEVKERNNPMVQLFYGQFVAEGVNEGKSFKNEETFGQFPLRVNGFGDIHESLEAATARGEIETVSTDCSGQSVQEQWFTRLPPVLTFELSRFQFNQNLGRPEKIHNKLEFPNLIYMDRYMAVSKQITRQKREQLKRLKEQLTVLQEKLDKFINFGSGAKRFPLQDVLQSALEFAETSSATLCDDVEMDSPKSSTSMQTDSPTCTPKRPSPSPSEDVSMVTPERPSNSSVGCRGNTARQPSPRFVAPEELCVLQSCLRRWRTEVESDVKELQDGIGSLEQTMGAMYGEPCLQKFVYRLHAVLVHEGQAASGHYWAYIYSTHFNTWLKFNDIMVTEASWEELVKESVGGYHNASAYCLMYVRDNSPDRIQGIVDAETGQCDDPSDDLQDDLAMYVAEDNERFMQEIADWDAEQRRRIANVSAGGDGSNMASTTQTPVRATPSLQHQHAMLASIATVDAIRRAITSDTFQNKGVEDTLHEVTAGELKRLEAMSKTLPDVTPRRDPRLGHVAVYMLSNRAPRDTLVRRALLEHFAVAPGGETDQRFTELRQAARQEEMRLRQTLTEEEEKDYKQYHHEYCEFRRTTLIFLAGVEQFHNESYASALPYFVCACEMNDDLTTPSQPTKGLNRSLLFYYRRQCLLQVNDVASTQFETESVLTETLDLMNRLILPGVALLTATSYQDDQSVVEDVREKWCSFLGEEVSREKIEQLQDFLAKLFDPPTEVKVMYPTSLKRVTDTPELCERYRAIMELSHHHAYLEAAANSK